jgi:transposase
MQRLVEFVHHYHLTIRLAYYPPYHSKYNPIERWWGILEHHWNGALLDTVDAVMEVMPGP